MLSKEEKTLGLSILNESGRLDFPVNIGAGQGETLVAETLDFDADGYDELALVSLDENGDHVFELLRPLDRRSMLSEWEPIFQLTLGDVSRAPEAIVVLDIFESNRLGLMLTIPRKAPILLAPIEEDGHRIVATESNIRESLLNGVSPAQISVFDVNGDERNELVVGRTGYARALRFDRDDLQMVDQFNAAQGDDPIDAVLPLQGDGSLEGIALYIRSAGEIQFLEAGLDGVFRYKRSESVGGIDLVGWSDLKGSGSQGIVFAGQDRFWVFSEGPASYTWEVVRSYETDLDEVHYSHASSADFDNDGRPEIIALDGSNHIANLLGFEDDAWHNRFFWEIFEVNMHYRGREGSKLEPRQILIEDLDVDGRLDLAMLVHDRILIYPGLN